MARRIKFYRARRGDSPVEDFILALPPKARAKCLSYLALVAERGNTLPANYIKHLQGSLWEMRPEFGGTEYRFFYVLTTVRVAEETAVVDAVVVLHAFTKKTQKTPPAEISRALSRLAEILEENKEQTP